MALKNYMSLKDEELKEIMTKFDLEESDYISENGSLNRKKLSNILRLIDIQAGKLAEAAIIDQAGNVEDHNPQGKLQKGLSGMMVKVTFYNSDENDLPYVQLALNGLALIIPREVESWIPKEFIDGVLQNAVATKMKMDVDRDGKIRYIPKRVPRVQYHATDIKHVDEIRKEYDNKRNKN